MRIFISWSGELSHKLACQLRDWLPSVIQHVRPYVSSEDIDKGARWSTDIAKELEESTYGVMCITRSNIASPWINFEAGALSKTVEKSRVSPVLYDLKRSEVNGPLLQFQSTVFEKEDFLKLVLSINKCAKEEERLDEARLTKGFDVWWPILKEAIDKLPKEAHEPGPPEKPLKEKGVPSILEELLELVRNQQRILRSPEMLLPPEYLDAVLRKRRGREYPIPDFEPAFDYLLTHYRRLFVIISELRSSEGTVAPEKIAEMQDLAKRCENVLTHISQNMPEFKRMRG